MVIRGNIKLNTTPGAGTGDPILTRDTTDGAVGFVGSIDSSTFISTTLTSGNIIVGNGSNVATSINPSGDIDISNTGVFSISTGVIINADINASAAVALTKLAATTASRALVSDASGFITPATTTSTELGYVNGVTSSIQTQLNSKQATITGGATTIATSNLTASRVLVSDGSGKVAVSTATATEIDYLSGVTSAIQTQITSKQTNIQFKEEGGNIGTSGAVTAIDFVGSGVVASHSAGTVTVTISGAANGLPTGGTAGQSLIKNSGTDYDASFADLELTDITDITATAAQVNVLSTGYYNATSSVQAQIDSKMSSALTNNYMFVGNVSNIASPLATGANGTVLTSVGGIPTWSAPGSGGTVTSVAASGGTTGLTFTGSPITVSGTLTLSGTLDEANGGTGNTSFTTGDILYASASNVLSKLAAGTNGHVLTLTTGIPSWTAKEDVITWSNGITKSGATGKLGGILIQDTSITSEIFTYDLTVTNTPSSYSAGISINDADATLVSNTATGSASVGANIATNAIAFLSAGGGGPVSIISIDETSKVVVSINTDTGATGEALMSNGAGGVVWATPSGGGLSDGDKGDITVGGGGTTLTVDVDISKTWTGSHVFTTNQVINSLEDAGTTTVLYPTKLRRTTSGTAAAGLGVGVQFEAENGSGTNKVGAIIEAVTTDVTAGSEDFDLVIKTMAAGASASERFRLKSTGELVVPEGTLGKILRTTVNIAGGATLRSIGSSPQTIIAAPGANKYLNIVSVALSYKYLTTAYDFGVTDNLCFTVGGVAKTSHIMAASIMNSGADFNGVLFPAESSYAVGLYKPSTNTAYTLTTLIGGNATTGSGDLDIVVYYTIEDVNT